MRQVFARPVLCIIRSLAAVVLMTALVVPSNAQQRPMADISAQDCTLLGEVKNAVAKLGPLLWPGLVENQGVYCVIINEPGPLRRRTILNVVELVMRRLPISGMFQDPVQDTDHVYRSNLGGGRTASKYRRT